MRVVVAVLFCVLMVGLGYPYVQESSVPTFLTAPVERGSISTLVRASGTVEAVITVDRQFAALWTGRGSVRQF